MTDKRVWMGVVEPTAATLAAQRPKAKRGLPSSWDPDALFDGEGRHLT